MGIKISGEFLFDGERRGIATEIGLNDDGANFVVRLVGLTNSGRYMTVLPISSRAFREKGGLTTAMIRDFGDSIHVYDDYGNPHTLEADRVHLETLLADCESKGLRIQSGV